VSVDEQTLYGNPTKQKNDGPTRNPPWRDHLDTGFEAVEGELEPNLIVSFARAAMGHEADGVEVETRTTERNIQYNLLTTLPIRDGDHSASDDGSC